MSKLNCWEIKKCGREPNGAKNQELGVCPTTIDSSCDGVNNGRNAGRICWTVAGTFCGGKVQGTFAQKQVSCMSCDVFKRVKEEEAPGIFELIMTAKACKV
jgi:hypothetical protein